MKIQKLKQVYYGAKATNYDATRMGAKWQAEQEAVHQFLKRIHEIQGGYSILDIPVGTGRFLEFYQEHEAIAEGVDVSSDMLAEAKKKAAELQYPVKLEIGNVFDLREKSAGFDVVLCIRLANWLDIGSLMQAIRQLSQASRRFIVFGVRVYQESERTAKSALVHWLREQVRRLKGNKITIHCEKRVQQALATVGLAVRDEQEIDRGPEGSCYAIYLLEKTGSG